MLLNTNHTQGQNLIKKTDKMNEIGLRTVGTLASGIDIGQGINVGPGKFGKKNNRRALSAHLLCSKLPSK